jgi:hypothetical protein
MNGQLHITRRTTMLAHLVHFKNHSAHAMPRRNLTFKNSLDESEKKKILYRVRSNQSLKLTESTACFFAARHGFTKRQNKT